MIQHPDKFSLSRVYKLTCSDCKKAYVGQTGRNFTVRYNEHSHAFRTSSRSSRFAQHLNEHAHSFDTIENTMQILHHHRKGAHLHTIQRYYIHAGHAANNHLNDDHTIFPNKIFDTLIKAFLHKPVPCPHTVNVPDTPKHTPLLKPCHSQKVNAPHTRHLYAPHISARIYK